MRAALSLVRAEVITVNNIIVHPPHLLEEGRNISITQFARLLRLASRAPLEKPAAQGDNRCELQSKVLRQNRAEKQQRLLRAGINS